MQNEMMELETETQFGGQFGAMDNGFEMDEAVEDAEDAHHMGHGMSFADVEEETVAEVTPNLDVIMNIPVTMQVVLGSTVMPVANLMKLGRGAVVKLDTNISDPVDLIVNGRIVARGEVVVLENEESRFGITLTEIVAPTARQPRAKGA
jgi:flagellar motor switch protein FliN